ncbi:MAG: HAMP domain-containing histidine kinase [Bacteroidaceae bacterium]|nr:HAMP domain-containing histidine kinase [Bacteroidaceae bacterium]
MFSTSLYPLVLEAIRNGDFSFRLPTKGVLPGERAARETINHMMELMQEQRQDIEMASWEKLTRTLTHEIMNSLAPIVSLSGTFVQEESIRNSDLYEGMKVIHETSKGLRSFVDGYRKFSSLQLPQPENIEVEILLRCLQTMAGEVDIEVKVEPANLQLHADPNLMRQVLMNLMKNAVEADAKHVLISAFRDKLKTVHIVFYNDGAPIPTAERNDIFVPFYTTKKTGNGIGLSLCRRMIQLSGGSIALLPEGTNGWNVGFELRIKN